MNRKEFFKKTGFFTFLTFLFDTSRKQFVKKGREVSLENLTIKPSKFAVERKERLGNVGK